MPIKISVLASGAVLLDGKPIELAPLDEALETAKKENRTVWYHREAPHEDAPPHAMQVLQLIVKHKLAISISSKPDFSDYVDAKGVSHPRAQTSTQPAAAAGVRMPAVELGDNIEVVFANVRKIAADEKEQRGLVIVRPDRKYLVMPRLSGPELKKMAAGLEKLIPGDVTRNIAVISYTEFGNAAAPSLTEANKSIPFLGLLMALAYIGHTVWVFEGHTSALEAGCRDADVLFVDSAMRPLLEKGWEDRAAAVMRNANILVHDRASFRLGIVRKVGASNERLEFRDQPLHA